jgi:hypothetical protein
VLRHRDDEIDLASPRCRNIEFDLAESTELDPI